MSELRCRSGGARFFFFCLSGGFVCQAMGVYQ